MITDEDRYRAIRDLRINITHERMGNVWKDVDGNEYISPVSVNCNGTGYAGRKSLDEVVDEIIAQNSGGETSLIQHRSPIA